MCSNAIKEAILSGNAKAAEKLTRQWLNSGHSAHELRDTALFPAVEAIREQFSRQAFASLPLLPAGMRSPIFRCRPILASTVSETEIQLIQPAILFRAFLSCLDHQCVGEAIPL